MSKARTDQIKGYFSLNPVLALSLGITLLYKQSYMKAGVLVTRLHSSTEVERSMTICHIKLLLFFSPLLSGLEFYFKISG